MLNTILFKINSDKHSWNITEGYKYDSIWPKSNMLLTKIPKAAAEMLQHKKPDCHWRSCFINALWAITVRLHCFLVSMGTKRPIKRCVTGEQITVGQVSGGQNILMREVRWKGGWRCNGGTAVKCRGRLWDPEGAGRGPHHLRHLLTARDWWGRADEPGSQCHSPIK